MKTKISPRTHSVSLLVWRAALGGLTGLSVLPLEDLTLVDLCTMDNYLAFLNWYFSLEADGGFYGAKEAGVTLAVLSQYLVAKGRMEETTPDGSKIWVAFYAQANAAIRVGAERGELSEEKDIGD